MYKVNSFGKEYNVEVYRSAYTENNTPAVMLVTDEGEPFAILTVNIEDSNNLERFGYKDAAFVDVNNCPWAESFLTENGLAKPLGLHGVSGYCEYPLYRFFLDRIKEY